MLAAPPREGHLVTTIAAVQASPVFLDREATIAKIGVLTKEAAAQGAALVVFPEAFVPAYPDWVWRTTPWADNEWYARFADQSVEIPSPACDALGAVAADTGTYLAIGVNERDGGTIYNTLLYFGPDGALLGKHRKLIPTGGERLVWGQGDGSTLSVFDTPFGRIGGLICWENYMPLARAAMYQQHVDIYLAPTWDNSDVWVSSMRHIAKEGGCYVVGVNSCIRGNTVIVDPSGTVAAGPLVEQAGIIYADIDLAQVQKARRHLDVVGHYARPDVFELKINRG
jgi:nitrilase